MTDTTIAVDLLGKVQLRVGEHRFSRFRTAKTACLLGYLSMHAGEPCSRDLLIELLWPDSEPNLSRNNLSQSLSAIRGQLASAIGSSVVPIVSDRQTITLHVPSESVDGLRVMGAARLADRAQTRGDTAKAEAYWREAAEAYSGTFMPGYYEPWCESMARELQLTAHRAAMQWAAASSGPQRLDALRRAMRIDPLDDAAYLQAIAELQSAEDSISVGRIAAEMKRAFDAIGIGVPLEIEALVGHSSESAEAISRSGLAPMPEVVTLVALSLPATHPLHAWPVELSAGQHGFAFASPSAALAWLGDYASKGDSKIVVTMGESARLSHLDHEAQRIWEWVQPGFIVASLAVATLTATTLPQEVTWRDLGSNLQNWRVLEGARGTQPPEQAVKPPSGDVEGLVRPTSRFVGREPSIGEAEAWLRSEGRVLVVTGPGGVGKTRFTQELALRNSSNPNLRWLFVELAPLATAESAMQAIAEAWVKDSKVEASDPRAVAMAADAHPTIAILDNLEHLLAEPQLTKWLHRLLSLSANLRVIASSRRRTGLPSESELRLDPLATPSLADSPDQLQNAESMRLLLDRVRSNLPDSPISDANMFELAHICRRLEGLPLAIELAAARLAIQSPRKLIERLSRRLDVDGKQKLLESTVSWSLELVEASTRALFSELSIFRGGFDLESVEIITGNQDAVDHLAELREVSLLRSSIQAGKHRFQILEVVREVGETFLAQDRKRELEHNHAAFFAELAARGDAHYATPDQRRWLDWLELDHDNLRMALDFFVASGEWEMALRMGSELWRFWHIRAHLSEGRSRLSSILTREETRSFPKWRARALNGLGRLTYLQGDYGESQTIHTEALELSRQVEDKDAESLAVQSIGAIAYELGNYAEALEKYQQSLAIRRQLGDQIGIGNSLNWLGIVLTDQGRFDEAEVALRDSLAIRREIGDMGGVARALTSLGIIARQTLRPDEARRAYQEALSLQRELGDQRAVAGLLSNLAMIAIAEGDLEEAFELLHEGLAIQRTVGDKWGIATLNANLSTVERKRGKLAAAAEHMRESLQLRLDIDNRWGVAFCLEGTASLALATGDAATCASLHHAASELRSAIGSPLPVSERPAVEAEVATARQAISEFSTVTYEEAIVLAFRTLDQALAS